MINFDIDDADAEDFKVKIKPIVMCECGNQMDSVPVTEQSVRIWKCSCGKIRVEEVSMYERFVEAFSNMNQREKRESDFLAE